MRDWHSIPARPPRAALATERPVRRLNPPFCGHSSDRLRPPICVRARWRGAWLQSGAWAWSTSWVGSGKRAQFRDALLERDRLLHALAQKILSRLVLVDRPVENWIGAAPISAGFHHDAAFFIGGEHGDELAVRLRVARLNALFDPAADAADDVDRREPSLLRNDARQDDMPVEQRFHQFDDGIVGIV